MTARVHHDWHWSRIQSLLTDNDTPLMLYHFCTQSRRCRTGLLMVCVITMLSKLVWSGACYDRSLVDYATPFALIQLRSSRNQSHMLELDKYVSTRQRSYLSACGLCEPSRRKERQSLGVRSPRPSPHNSVVMADRLCQNPNSAL